MLAKGATWNFSRPGPCMNATASSSCSRPLSPSGRRRLVVAPLRAALHDTMTMPTRRCLRHRHPSAHPDRILPPRLATLIQEQCGAAFGTSDPWRVHYRQLNETRIPLRPCNDSPGQFVRVRVGRHARGDLKNAKTAR